MFTNLLKTIKEYIYNRPKIKKGVGVILILLGLAALVTPLTPGSWLVFFGLGLLGFRMLFLDKIKAWFSAKGGSQPKAGHPLAGAKTSGGQKDDPRETK